MLRCAKSCITARTLSAALQSTGAWGHPHQQQHTQAAAHRQLQTLNPKDRLVNAQVNLDRRVYNAEATQVGAAAGGGCGCCAASGSGLVAAKK